MGSGRQSQKQYMCAFGLPICESYPGKTLSAKGGGGVARGWATAAAGEGMAKI